MSESATAPYKSTMVMRNDPGEVGQADAVDHRGLRGGSYSGEDVVCGATLPRRGGGEHLAARCATRSATCCATSAQHAAQHAAGTARASTISASLERGDAGVWLDIEDDGEAFDPTAAAPRAPAPTLELLPVGGLGIHLMRQYSSRIEYSRSGGRNRLRLTFTAR